MLCVGSLGPSDPRPQGHFLPGPGYRAIVESGDSPESTRNGTEQASPTDLTRSAAEEATFAFSWLFVAEGTVGSQYLGLLFG